MYSIGRRVPWRRLARYQGESQEMAKWGSLDAHEYTGPFSKPLRTLKYVSLSTCSFIITGTPILTSMATNINLDTASKAAICFVVSGFSVFTTSAFHYITKSYVHRGILSNPEEDTPGEITLSRLSIFGFEKNTTLPIADLTPTSNLLDPSVNFADQEGNTYHIDVPSLPEPLKGYLRDKAQAYYKSIEPTTGNNDDDGI